MNFILPIRIAQLILALLVLGTSAYVASVYNSSPSEINFLVFTSIWTLLALIYLSLTSWKLERFAHPWIICGVESLTMLFWFAGFIAAAVFLGDLITCAGKACSSAKAATVFAAFESLDESAPAPLSEDERDHLPLSVHYHGQPISLTLANDATIFDLSTLVAEDLQIPPSNQKFLISPKPGLLRPPFKDPCLRLDSLPPKAKITLLGSTAQEVADVESAISTLKQKQQARRAALNAGRKVQATRHRDQKTATEEATYTFATLRPLPHLHQPEKSLRFLERLRDDPGIKSAMRKHKYSVGLLTEMDPAEHTTHESRTLGLNRNRGEVIELRLRTDAYDGYRDYKVIRKTLCHELAHNDIGPHNAEFHALWNQIEKEVEKNDWSRGGNSLGREEFYNPGDDYVDDDDHCDAGGWEGGSYVLGSLSSQSSAEPLSRREAMARAAEARAKKQNNSQKTADHDSNAPPT
ncbi:WLM-domain-containing protein [Aureobasidium subglaciale]|nr:WLM-domain-containing protein [Aureobasidium subglaciale]KAI5273372.1 WLM-domain-containing protein [Aureobasidium subglaciale]